MLCNGYAWVTCCWPNKLGCVALVTFPNYSCAQVEIAGAVEVMADTGGRNAVRQAARQAARVEASSLQACQGGLRARQKVWARGRGEEATWSSSSSGRRGQPDSTHWAADEWAAPQLPLTNAEAGSGGGFASMLLMLSMLPLMQLMLQVSRWAILHEHKGGRLAGTSRPAPWHQQAVNLRCHGFRRREHGCG